ncbi:MAG: 4-hydroxy-tetrahydrodipicolinate reductase [Acidobacteriota bacterium]|nr:4-hydroxy-tetrahydrodipicolinate reductase [Acidobacteriota bacterium]
MKIALIGYGKMGRAVEQAALERGHEIVARVGSCWGRGTASAKEESELNHARVCVEFSRPEAALPNLRRIAELGKPLVVGTTGWYRDLPLARRVVEEGDTACVYAPNFSLGLNLYLQVVERAARLFGSFEDYDVLANETHHRQKIDSPSGTAGRIGEILLEQIPRKRRIVTGSLNRPIAPDELHLLAGRAGHFPGTHSVTFDSPADSVELVHRARSRLGFALGAVLAAEWVQGRRGFYSFSRMLQEILDGQGTADTKP